MSLSHTVLTHSHASKLKGPALPPVQYEQACKALAECRSIDDAKQWNTKAEALAAWAKVYHSKQAMNEARKLRLHAYRRMAELSSELRPASPGSPEGGRLPGSQKLLEAYGFTRKEAQQIRGVGNAPAHRFAKAVESNPVPTVRGFLEQGVVSKDVDGLKSFDAFRYFTNRVKPELAAKRVLQSDVKARLLAARQVRDWCDEFAESLEQRAAQAPGGSL